jgi:hypothetical protein
MFCVDKHQQKAYLTHSVVLSRIYDGKNTSKHIRANLELPGTMHSYVAQEYAQFLNQAHQTYHPRRILHVQNRPIQHSLRVAVRSRPCVYVRGFGGFSFRRLWVPKLGTYASPSKLNKGIE